MIIAGTRIDLGESKRLEIHVGDLPSGTPIDIHMHVFRSKKEGPTLLLMAGLHGDEINGVETLRRALIDDYFKKLKVGNVILIPLLNVFGFINFSRSVRDGKDVNRSFPGTKNGSLASRVAYLMSNEVLPHIDIGVDFHTGGSSIHNHPQLRVTLNDPNSIGLAEIFAPPFILKNRPIARSHRKQALSMGKSILVYEGGESLRLDEDSILEGLNGVKRLMHHLGMIENSPKKSKSVVFDRSKWIRSPRAGVVNLYAKAGDKVKKGEVLAIIHNLDKLSKRTVICPEECFILSHVNNPVVSKGDALFHLGF